MSEQREFENVLQVVGWLQRRGFVVGKSKVYNDVKAGRLSKGAGGLFTQKAVEAYSTALKTIDPGRVDDEAAALRLVELEGKARSAGLDADLKQVKLLTEQGRVISVGKYNEDFADAARILRDSGVQFFTTMIKEIIFRCNGDPAKEEELREYLRDQFHGWLHGFSKKVVHEVPEENVS